MLNPTRLLTVICLFLAAASASFGNNVEPKGRKPKPKIAYMEIASVDTTAMTITIQAMNSTASVSKTYKFTAKTKVTINGHDGMISDLKPGLQIRVGTGSDEGVAEALSASAPPADPNKK